MDETTRYLKKACLAWEKLRVVYNALLLVEGLIGLWTLRRLGERADHLCPNVFGPGVWRFIILFGVVANVFYCVGPLVEAYTSVVLARRMNRGRYVLFVAGLLFSMYVILCLWMRGWGHIGGHLR